MPQEFSAGLIAFKRAETLKFLLLKYPGGYWGFPRGNVEEGENSRETAIREFKEETGLSQKKIFEGFKHRIEYFYRREGQTIHKDVVFYLAEAEEGDVKLAEHTGYGWFSFEEAMEKLKFRNNKEALEKASQFLNEYYQ